MGVLALFAEQISAKFIVAILSTCAVAWLMQTRFSQQTEFPLINQFPRDWNRKKAEAAFVQDAQKLIREGFRKFGGPFRIITLLGTSVVLPTEYAEWVRQSPDVSHQALAAEQFFAKYPGFEGETAVSHADGLLINVIKAKLSQNKFSVLFMNSATKFLKNIWTDNKEWHDIYWAKDGTELIGQMSSSIFVGDHLASNAEWQKTSISYAINMFQGARALRTWPAWTRPLIHWFIPECNVCRAEVKKADSLIQAELQRRSMSGGRYDDTITWMHQAAKGRPYNATANQLGLSMAAVVTTSELLKQCLVELCASSVLIAPLREEIEQVISQHGWTGAALAQMQLMDSIIKETQRLNPLSEVNLERKVIRTTTLPNGQVLPAGTNISVHTASLLDPSIYPNPIIFDGARFLKLRRAGGKWENAASAVSTSAEHFVFGLGRFICPGRFMAIAEVKIALAIILSEYDVRFVEGYVPKTVRYGFEILGDPEAQLQVKKRAL